MKKCVALFLLVLFSCENEHDPASPQPTQNQISVDFQKSESPGLIQSQLEGSWKVIVFYGGWGCQDCPPKKEFMTWHEGNFTWTRADTVVASGPINWEFKQTPIGTMKWTMANFYLTPDDIKEGKLSINRDEAAVDGWAYVLERE